MKPDIHPEVAAALADAKPVVALESTIIAHGLPSPTNVEVARSIEAAVREEGAVPALVVVLDGRARVGIEDGEVDRVGALTAKLSTADVSAAMATGTSGATTVAATMAIAAWAGIEVFATGGIGGVHRGADTSFDVSADITELAHTRVAVVSSGAKSILDMAATLEALETARVPVLGHGTAEFPAFYSPSSPFPIPHQVESPGAAAAVIRAHWAIPGTGGVLVANPVPEDAGLEFAEVEAWIGTADAEAKERGITGKRLTPFLLNRLFELSRGRTIDANVALIHANARFAARLAGELQKS